MFTTRRYHVSSLYRQPVESMKGFLSKRWSFWLAFISCVAFLVGNMVGQHGWHAFWKSVWGAESEIVFTGTVPPLPRIPDPERWNGSGNDYNYSDVPERLLIPMPAYKPTHGCAKDRDRKILSVDYDGDYDSGGTNCGSHPAADILVPRGTPVVAVMNGVVERVERRGYGFGNTVVIRHPNVPDPHDREHMTTLHSAYAHLGSILVSENMVVHKGQQIAVTGQTGFATAPHLHFQIDNDKAPFHPYWPFTTIEAATAGLSFVDAVNVGLGQERAEEYTTNPLSYVSAYADWSSSDGMLLAGDFENAEQQGNAGMSDGSGAEAGKISNMVVRKSFLERLKERIAVRLARRLAHRYSLIANRHQKSIKIVARTAQNTSGNAVVSTVAKASVELPRGDGQDASPPVASTAPMDISMPKFSPKVAGITILHDGEFDHGWEEIVLFARDKDGNFLKDVKFDGKIYMEATFGNAEFSPSVLTYEQFDERGRAFVRMYPHGIKTVIPSVRGAFAADGEPMLNSRIVSARPSAGQGG